MKPRTASDTHRRGRHGAPGARVARERTLIRKPLLPPVIGHGFLKVGFIQVQVTQTITLPCVTNLLQCRGSTGHFTSSRRLRKALAEKFTLQVTLQQHFQTTAWLPFLHLWGDPTPQTVGSSPCTSRCRATGHRSESSQKGLSTVPRRSTAAAI